MSECLTLFQSVKEVMSNQTSVTKGKLLLAQTKPSVLLRVLKEDVRITNFQFVKCLTSNKIVNVEKFNLMLR